MARQINETVFIFPGRGRGAELRGRIDRVDVNCRGEDNQLYVKVIDYKSGATKLDLLKVYYGLQLQLALYLGAAMELEEKRFPKNQVRPAGIFYYNVKDPVLNQEGYKKSGASGAGFLKKTENGRSCRGRAGNSGKIGQKSGRREKYGISGSSGKIHGKRADFPAIPRWRARNSFRICCGL